MGRLGSIDSLATLQRNSPALSNQQPPYPSTSVNVSSTAALLRVLSEFTTSTSDVFSGLYESTLAMQERINNLTQRVQVASQSAEVLLSKESFTSRPTALLGNYGWGGAASDLDVRYEGIQGVPEPGAAGSPAWAREIQERLQACTGGFDLSPLDRFTEQPGTCMKKFSDPVFFVNKWVQQQEERLVEEKKTRKLRRQEMKAKQERNAKGNAQGQGEKKQTLVKKEHKTSEPDFSSVVIRQKPAAIASESSTIMYKVDAAAQAAWTEIKTLSLGRLALATHTRPPPTHHAPATVIPATTNGQTIVNATPPKAPPQPPPPQLVPQQSHPAPQPPPPPAQQSQPAPVHPPPPQAGGASPPLPPPAPPASAVHATPPAPPPPPPAGGGAVPPPPPPPLPAVNNNTTPPPPPPPPATGGAGGGAPPPLPPPPPAAGGGGGGGEREDLMAAIKEGVKLQHVDPAAHQQQAPKPLAPRDALLEQIRAGRNLKKAAERQEAAPPPPKQTGPLDMAAVLHQRLEAMHKVMKHDDSDDDDGEDEWSDDD